IPILSTTSAFAPRLATLSETYTLSPFSTDITATSVVTARITPSNVRNVRSLCERNVSSAMRKVSCRATAARWTCVNREGSLTLSIIDGGRGQKVRRPPKTILKLFFGQLHKQNCGYNRPATRLPARNPNGIGLLDAQLPCHRRLRHRAGATDAFAGLCSTCPTASASVRRRTPGSRR